MELMDPTGQDEAQLEEKRGNQLDASGRIGMMMYQRSTSFTEIRWSINLILHLRQRSPPLPPLSFDSP